MMGGGESRWEVRHETRKHDGATTLTWVEETKLSTPHSKACN